MVAMYRLTASGSLSPQKARWMASSQVNVWGQMLGSTRGGLHWVYPCWPRRWRWILSRKWYRRRRIQQQLQPPPEPTPAPEAHTTECNFTISITHRPQARPTLSLIASLPYCVCCLCGYDHSTPDCPPSSALPPAPHTCQLQTTEEDSTDPTTPLPQAILSDTDWTALHWDIWQAQDLNSIPPPPAAPSNGSQDTMTPPDSTARPSKSRRLRSQTTIHMYFSAINPNGHTANAPNVHHRPPTTSLPQQPPPTPAQTTSCPPTTLPTSTQHRKPTTNILQYILNRNTATLTSPETTSTPTLHGNPRNHQLTATITRSNTNSTTPTNDPSLCPHIPTTHRHRDNTETIIQQHSATAQRPIPRSPPTANNIDKLNNANSNSTPPNPNATHHSGPTGAGITANANSLTSPRLHTNHTQAPIIDTNSNSTPNADNEPTNYIPNSTTSTNNATYNCHPTATAPITNMNSTSITDNETNNSHPTAMDTMDNSLYSLNPLPTPTPDCEAVPETVG